jgi:hypothetical protein
VKPWELVLLMGMTVDAFFEMNKGAVLSVEEAGAGFAASVVFAEKFRGQEISSIQALKAADIAFGSTEIEKYSEGMDTGRRKQAREACARVRKTLQEQSDGWKHRSLFERQWVIRDFKKTAGMPVEEWLLVLTACRRAWALKGLQRTPARKTGGILQPPGRAGERLREGLRRNYRKT